MANPLKVLTALSASSGVSVSNGLNVVSGDATIQGVRIATVTGALAPYATLAGVTGALGSYATLTGVTGALASYATLSGVSSSFVAKDGSGNVTIAGNLTVQGTTTSIDSNTVNIGDKNINLGTGSTDLAVLNGGGLDLGTSAQVQWRYDNGNTAWTSNKDVNVTTGNSFKINGTSVLSSNTLGSGVTNSSLTSLGTITSLTASALNVTGEVKLDGSSITLGNASTDIVTVTGQLTASEGVKIASGKTLSIDTVSALNKGDVTHPNLGAQDAVILSYNGTSQGSYVSVLSASSGPLPGTFVDISSSLQTLVRGEGVGGMLGGVTIEGGGGGVEIMSAGTAANSISLLSTAGGIKLQSDSTDDTHSLTLSTTGSSVSGTVVQGKLHVEDNNGTYSNFTLVGGKLGGQYTNITGAFAAIDAALGSVMGGATVTPTEYYNLRTVVKGVKQAGNDTVVFTISGSSNANQTGRTPSGKGLTSMSSSNADTLVSTLMAGLSFDIATKVPNTGLWSNDLVSVQLSASTLQAGFYWPQITVDAPSLTDGSEIRLIVVNENSDVIV